MKKMTYEEAMAMALKHLEKEAELELLGTIPETKMYLLQELQNAELEHELLHDEMAAKISAYADSLDEEHKPKCDAYKEQIHNILDEMIESAGIEKERINGVPLALDGETGEILIEKKGPVN